MNDTINSERHWLWVTRPEHYLEDDGTERRDLEPSAGFSPSAWWTCSPHTRTGDTVLLYRSGIKKDISHFLVVRSDPEQLDRPGHPLHGKPICQFEVIERLQRSVPWSAIKENSILRDWGANRTRFVKSAVEVPADCWSELVRLAGYDSKMPAKQAADGLHRIRLEREIQRRLMERKDLLERAGLGPLTFVVHEYIFGNGRRADLLYSRGRGLLKQDVVVELKRGEIGAHAVKQVSDYADLLRSECGRPRRRPIMVVIGDSLRSDAAHLVGGGARRPRFLSLAQLGISRVSNARR
ncbi:endonuclease NucS [Pseudonocardia sp. RS11V-5]|uniref:endonuclease NucS domain-containing protein n=1 Tax=Pseudonocardia terrae TaxID=2905831 RepID=UPI001E2B56E6|nr:endonuclease NucS domain-containing protein [Pseudonocardia terrae]MCE3554504.1 endonuclease NucS [Pseudonocardia terrae]